jgi:hypothetical protein
VDEERDEEEAQGGQGEGLLMTEQEWTILGEYIRWVANEMGLRDWWIHLAKEPPEGEDADASIFPTQGRKHAVIHVCRGFRELLPDVQRQVIVHELIHCHLAAAEDVIRLDLCATAILGQAVYDMTWSTFKRSVEYAVDGMADAWAEKLPLIEWEKVEDAVA